MKQLTKKEAAQIKGGEVITLTTVTAILAIGLMIVIIYRLFMSDKGSTTLPGGFKFTWD
ncbi:MAG: hypothetical protein GX350_03230 [Erysipelotrichaceae bacterium]|nr:hypothetical protein [Erysipelotrichaceae bacterium]